MPLEFRNIGIPQQPQMVAFMLIAGIGVAMAAPRGSSGSRRNVIDEPRTRTLMVGCGVSNCTILPEAPDASRS